MALFLYGDPMSGITKIMAAVLIISAISFCGIAIAQDQISEDSDATTLNWTVGTAISKTTIGPAELGYSGSVPGVTFSVVNNVLYAMSGTPTTAGTYEIVNKYYDGVPDQDTTTIVVSAAATSTYTCYLYYNANGGSGAPSTDSYTGTSKTSHTFTVSSTTPSRSGYTFLGWSTSSTATSSSYSGGSSISVTYNGSKTLYAVWEENVSTITITVYKGNWASFKLLGVDTSNVTSSSKKYTVNAGQSIDVDWYGSSSTTSGSQSSGYITTMTYSSSNYNMVKGTSLSYPGGGSDSLTAESGGKYYPAVKMTSSSSTTYYFSISYNANGGSGAPSSTDGGSSSSSSKSITLSSTKPTRSGYTFLGWSTSSTATSASYSSGSSYSFSYGTTPLYAVWKQNTYTCYLYYNANGGSGAPTTQSFTGTSTSNHSFTVASSTPTKSGCVFLGWSTSSTATSPSYTGGSSISVSYNGSQTLYAVWSVEPTLSFTSYPTVACVSMPTITYNDDGSYVIS